MKTFEEDKELRQLIKSIKLDKPAPDFTRLVMNQVFQEHTSMEQVKAEPLLGKGFWIIVALFGILMVAMFFLSGSSPAAESGKLLPDISSGELMSGYRAFFENLGSLPASIAGISFGISLLVFLERFLTAAKPELA